MIKISVFYEDKHVTDFEQVEKKDISIGRAAGCSVLLDETSISRLHAVIRFQGSSWVLERRASFGAVLLNGTEIENAPLEGGEEVSIGKFILRINIENSGASKSFSPPAISDDHIYQEDGEGRTRVVATGLNPLFRFEPGSANITEFVMEKSVAVFGRGSNCDVVLTEKKASRKHCEIRRQGLSFFLKDLNSANGLQVNGSAVTEAELVPGDIIQIGETKIQFIIENKDYFSRQEQFLAVPTHLQQAGLSEGAVPDFNHVPGLGMEGAAGASIPGMEPAEPPLSPTDYLGRAKRAWSKIPRPQRMRYLSILVVFALVSALLGGPDEKPKPKPKTGAAGARTRTYEQLTPAKKKLVRDSYGLLLKAQEKKEFTKMLDQTRVILTYVDDYKDTGIYEKMAKKKLEEIEEEKKRVEAEKKQEALRREVKALEEKGKPIYEKSLDDAKYRPELETVIQEIYSKDPNNRLAQEWKEGIKRKDIADKEEAEAARLKAEQKEKAEQELANAKSTFEAGRYVQALAETAKIAENGWTEGDYSQRLKDLEDEIRNKLRSILDPLLMEAKNQRTEGGDLVKANELYNEVLKVDPANQEAISGKASIKETLHMRAKRYYAEGILAESISDLSEAKEKFEKCLRWAPDGDSYKTRCRKKLSRFEYFRTDITQPISN